MARKIARGNDAEKIKNVDLLKNNNLDLLIPTNGVEIALTSINQMVMDEKVPAATKLAAARTILEIAGLLGPGARKAGGNGLESMSDADLRRAIDAHQSALADRAKPVNAPPSDDTDANLLIDLG